MRVAQPFTHLTNQSYSKKRNQGRVGLLYQATGIPVFLIYLRGLESPFYHPLISFEEAAQYFHQERDPQNQLAWKMVLGFFQAGGTLLHVCMSPLSGSSSSEYLPGMIGQEKGFALRSGIFALKNAVDRADLVVIPQSASLLSSQDYLIFCQSLFDWISHQPNFFAMMDLPKSLSPTEAIHWASDLKSPDAALYYPWILDESEVRPSSPSIAAAYQLSDRRYGISDTPANRALDSKLTPLMHLSQIQASQLNLNRINTLLYFRDQSARIWGTETLRLRDDSEFQFISTRRTMKALTEAMTTICESFVLEPLKEDISLIVSNELEDFCLAHKYLFNLEKQKPYRIQVNAVTSTDSSGLHVDCEFHLNTCIEAIQISIGLRN